MTRVLLVSFLFLIPGCGMVEDPPIGDLAANFIRKIAANDGSLGTLGMADCPEALKQHSITELPDIDWSTFESVEVKGWGARGPGGNEALIKEFALAFTYRNMKYENLITIPVRFEIKTTDGKLHTGRLALRPVNGEMSILPQK